MDWSIILEDVVSSREIEPVGATIGETLLSLRLPVTMFQTYAVHGDRLVPIPYWTRYDDVRTRSDGLIVRALRNTLFDTILPQVGDKQEEFESGTGFEVYLLGSADKPAAAERRVLGPEEAQQLVVGEVDGFVEEHGIAERGCVFGVSGGGDSNALAYGLQEALPRDRLLAFTLVFRDVMTSAAADRATVLCQDLGIEHVVLERGRLADLLGVRTSIDALYDDFADTFGHEAIHFFGTFLILRTARELGRRRELADLAFGYNREDLLAELLFQVTNGRAPLAYPVREIGPQRIVMPVWRIPKLLLDACHPLFSLENYRERDPHTTAQRSLAFYLGHSLDSAYPSFGLSLLEGMHTAFEGRFGDLEYDPDLDVYVTRMADDRRRVLVGDLLARHFN
jgi:hypothetical protein